MNKPTRIPRPPRGTVISPINRIPRPPRGTVLSLYHEESSSKYVLLAALKVAQAMGEDSRYTPACVRELMQAVHNAMGEVYETQAD